MSERPTPEQMLARAQLEEAERRRGRLKIFFGYAAGVGKTYAMLQAAHRERAAGVDVVVGYVELHGRAETEALLQGLEVLPTRSVEHRGVVLRELDLDAVLKRHPKLAVIDELAHSNAPGSRHTKRWQDVQELLDGGIDVFTSLNVQHLESLNDIIAQITGIAVRETLPDAVFERADEIELIDLTPDELADRLRAGKIYVTEQAERAIQRFFQKPNLIALRELSLRRTADRINEQVQAERFGNATRKSWPTTERLLVCVGPSPTSAKLIRSTKRLADTLRAEWIAAYVEPFAESQLSVEARHRIVQHLKLAESLGAETVSLSGRNVAEEIISYARSRNVSKLVVGKTDEPWWRSWRRSINSELLRLSGEIDVYVIHGETEAAVAATPASKLHASQAAAIQKQLRESRLGYVWAAVTTAFSTGLAALMRWQGIAETNLVMAYLLGVVCIATWCGRGPSIAASVAGVLCFDFFFVAPEWTFAVTDSQYVVTFGVMLIVALSTSSLTARIREQVQSARLREQRTAALFRLSQQLAGISGSDFLVTIAGKHVQEILGGEVVIFLPADVNKVAAQTLAVRFGNETSVARNETDCVVAQWVYEHHQIAGAGTDTLPNATAMFLPLIGSQGTVGVLGIKPVDLDRLRSPDQGQLLETCVNLTALALERDLLTLQAQTVKLQAETERLRNALLSAVSHDLRTPLAVIGGASDNLLQHDADPATRAELLNTIVDESHRMSRLVDNLLEMTRIDAAGVQLNKQWQVIEEVVGSALHRLRRQLGDRKVVTNLPPDLPLVPFDGVLIEQVLINILENATKYTPESGVIEIQVRAEPRQLLIEILDEGPGLPEHTETLIFDKFYRGPNAIADGRRGAGLGLTICREIIIAHGGQIGAENRPSKGARIWFTLPIDGPPPRVDVPQE